MIFLRELLQVVIGERRDEAGDCRVALSCTPASRLQQTTALRSAAAK